MNWTRALSSLNTILSMRCREAAPFISQMMDRDLPPVDRTAVRLHLSICPSCRRYRRQLVLLRGVLALLRDPPTVPPVAHPAAHVQPLSHEARERIRLALGCDPTNGRP